ncbi:MAG: hypothetical protein QM775_35310 [Pirellulales bacterium]
MATGMPAANSASRSRSDSLRAVQFGDQVFEHGGEFDGFRRRSFDRAYHGASVAEFQAARAAIGRHFQRPTDRFGERLAKPLEPIGRADRSRGCDGRVAVVEKSQMSAGSFRHDFAGSVSESHPRIESASVIHRRLFARPLRRRLGSGWAEPADATPYANRPSQLSGKV